MPHSCSRTACSNLEIFWIGLELCVGIGVGGDRERGKTEMAFAFFIFYLSSVWIMAYSQKQRRIFINLFIVRSFTRYLVC